MVGGGNYVSNGVPGGPFNYNNPPSSHDQQQANRNHSNTPPPSSQPPTIGFSFAQGPPSSSNIPSSSSQPTSSLRKSLNNLIQPQSANLQPAPPGSGGNNNKYKPHLIPNPNGSLTNPQRTPSNSTSNTPSSSNPSSSTLLNSLNNSSPGLSTGAMHQGGSSSHLSPSSGSYIHSLSTQPPPSTLIPSFGDQEMEMAMPHHLQCGLRELIGEFSIPASQSPSNSINQPVNSAPGQINGQTSGIFAPTPMSGAPVGAQGNSNLSSLLDSTSNQPYILSELTPSSDFSLFFPTFGRDDPRSDRSAFSPSPSPSPGSSSFPFLLLSSFLPFSFLLLFSLLPFPLLLPPSLFPIFPSPSPSSFSLPYLPFSLPPSLFPIFPSPSSFSLPYLPFPFLLLSLPSSLLPPLPPSSGSFTQLSLLTVTFPSLPFFPVRPSLSPFFLSSFPYLTFH